MTIPADDTTGELSLTSGAPEIVLDTNVVLDWLVFGEPTVAALVDAVESGRVRWLATAAMRDELSYVLARGLATSRGSDVAAALARWDALAVVVPGAAVHPLRCSDLQDQKFVDLALSRQVRWLVSRDRALLRLARRAMAVGTRILTPERWKMA